MHVRLQCMIYVHKKYACKEKNKNIILKIKVGSYKLKLVIKTKSGIKNTKMHACNYKNKTYFNKCLFLYYSM